MAIHNVDVQHAAKSGAQHVVVRTTDARDPVVDDLLGGKLDRIDLVGNRGGGPLVLRAVIGL